MQKKKEILLLCIFLSVLGMVFTLGSSYFLGSGEQVITADEAIVLTLGGTETLNDIVIYETAASEYLVTAQVSKSSGVDDLVNGSLTFAFEETDGKSFSLLTFYVYQGDTLLKSLEGAGSITITDIEQTTEYSLIIKLTDNNGERYAPEQLLEIGGKLTISFTTGGNQ